MSSFKGHRTGFNKTGSNECVPNEMGPPSTKFGGRPAVPKGPLQRYPGAAADISNGNRRLAKAKHGDGAGDGVNFTGRGAFSPNAGASRARTYNTGGGVGSGFRKGGKKP